MIALSVIPDKRIGSTNVFVETTIGEYLGFAYEIIENNELQRRKVQSSKSVYSLLKSDLKQGCVIPPLVLAVTEYSGENDGDKILEYIKNNTNKVMILDGLQRTYTLMAAKEDFVSGTDDYHKYMGYALRLEIYISINKFGILYRMLTLNTGQTPMSLRHQIEILYKGMLDTDIDGIRLVTETSGGRITNPKTLKYKDAVEGFHSYVQRDELPIERQDLLENVKTLENLSTEDTQKDLFKEYVVSYATLLEHLDTLFGQGEISSEEAADRVKGSPFAKSALKAFQMSQALTGYGAAVGRMKELSLIDSFDQIVTLCSKISPGGNDTRDWFFELLHNLQSIKEHSKKIGSGQRMYFHYFFRELLNHDSDSYLDLLKSASNGYQKYRSQI